ncbi:MAG: nitrophenyl compound nitroreductase subunit ArsF family protein [Bacteroidales bacterium]
MKKILLLPIFIILLASCSGPAPVKESTQAYTTDGKVEVYYFHFSRRCETCQAVESVSRESVQELYGEKVLFADVNLDDSAGVEKGKAMGVSGQSLLVVSGSNKIDITSTGFLYARENPEKLKETIREKADSLLAL